MTYLIIGSVAMGRPNPKDLDIVCTYDNFTKLIRGIRDSGMFRIQSVYPSNAGKKMIAKLIDDSNSISVIEADIAWPYSLAEDLLEVTKHSSKFYPPQLEWNHNHIKTFSDHIICRCALDDIPWQFAGKDVCYMLKMSHRFLKNSPHFKKTMDDINWMRTNWLSKDWLSNHKESHVQDHLVDHYNRRMREQYNYSHPKLNVEKNEFFSGDGIDYVYDHDSIHEAIMPRGKLPTYTRYSNGPVSSSYELFEKLDYFEQLDAVAEECYVLALERSIIPFKRDWKGYKPAFEMALTKVCTSITSGWFREFSWENYHHILARYDSAYFHRFNVKLDEGEIKLYEKDSQ